MDVLESQIEPPRMSKPESFTETDLPGDTNFVKRTEEFAREEPMQALGVAFIAGLILTILPVGRLLGGLVRLAFGLLRPALVILGAVKLYEEISHKDS
jgi:hypothetical protein